MISTTVSIGWEWVGNVNREGTRTAAGICPSGYREGVTGNIWPSEDNHVMTGSKNLA